MVDVVVLVCECVFDIVDLFELFLWYYYGLVDFEDVILCSVVDFYGVVMVYW